MIYTRDHAADYNHWAALGNRGWSYADVLPLFKRAEHHEAGASAFHGTSGPLKNGESWSVSRAYLHPVLKRPNLTVITGAHVTRVILDGKRATGIPYLQSGKIGTLHARPEVILACLYRSDSVDRNKFAIGTQACRRKYMALHSLVLSLRTSSQF